MKHPPSQSAIELELYKEFSNGDFSAMAVWLDRDRSYISKLYNPNDTDHKSPFYLASRHLFAAKETRPDLALGLYRVWDRVARQILGDHLLQEQPISILKLAIDQLRQTSRDDIKAMSRDERALLEMYAGELREVAGHCFSDAIGVRNELEGSPRGSDVGGLRAAR